MARALASTYRFSVDGSEHLVSAQALGRPILACWHGRILPAVVYFRDQHIVAITSENFDGEWMARILTKFGYGTARGSSSRGARKALRQLVRDVREKTVAFTVDGPRGPARVAQPGAVWLSKATGNPVLPFHIESAKHWSLRSWDRTQVPKPFTTLALSFAAPLVVARTADAGVLDEQRRALERALEDCETRCRAMLST
ncbi:MAG: lysophospholipid acyltransferase family protein [Acidobacteria bacterium]|nr:lysophospholipid acyltransferase family protein [Acidobacteriota bacterium]